MQKSFIFPHEISEKKRVELLPLVQEKFSDWFNVQDAFAKRYIESCNFKAESGELVLLPNTNGELQTAVIGLKDEKDFFQVGSLPLRLPPVQFELAGKFNTGFIEKILLAWGMGAYQFTQYKKPKRIPAKLSLPSDIDSQELSAVLDAIYRVRDLVNTPPNEMGPDELEAVAHSIAKTHKAKFSVISGEKLLKANFPAIYTVGKGSSRAPRLIEFSWGDRKHPKITLIGKGVCFDTGGLDLKPLSNMLLMKKDMGGAAHVLALAELIMRQQMPLCLQVLIPAVENSVSGNCYRPSDVIRMRNGLTVEIGDTDAEGRLIIADALAYAASQKPDYIMDFTTLTGAARAALGPDIPPYFCNDEMFSQMFMDASVATSDPIWRLPLVEGYEEMIASQIADLNNCSNAPFAGCITAGLFLKRFVDAKIPWIHLDLYAWNYKDRPARPLGGEAMSLRATYRMLQTIARSANLLTR